MGHATTFLVVPDGIQFRLDFSSGDSTNHRKISCSALTKSIQLLPPLSLQTSSIHRTYRSLEFFFFLSLSGGVTSTCHTCAVRGKRRIKKYSIDSSHLLQSLPHVENNPSRFPERAHYFHVWACEFNWKRNGALYAHIRLFLVVVRRENQQRRQCVIIIITMNACKQRFFFAPLSVNDKLKWKVVSRIMTGEKVG